MMRDESARGSFSVIRVSELSRWKTVEGFADEIGTFPDREGSEVNFGWLHHSRHVLAKPSALLP